MVNRCLKGAVLLSSAMLTTGLACNPAVSPAKNVEDDESVLSARAPRVFDACSPDGLDMSNVMARVQIDLAAFEECPAGDICVTSGAGGGRIPYELVGAPLLGTLPAAGFLFHAGSTEVLHGARRYLGNGKRSGLLIGLTEGPGDLTVCGFTGNQLFTWYGGCSGDPPAQSDLREPFTTLLLDDGPDHYIHITSLHPGLPGYVSSEPDNSFRTRILRSTRDRVTRYSVEAEISASLARVPLRSSPNAAQHPSAAVEPDWFIARGWLLFPRPLDPADATRDAGGPSSRVLKSLI